MGRSVYISTFIHIKFTIYWNRRDKRNPLSLDSTLDEKKINHKYSDEMFYNPTFKQRDKLKLLSLEMKFNCVKKKRHKSLQHTYNRRDKLNLLSLEMKFNFLKKDKIYKFTSHLQSKRQT